MYKNLFRADTILIIKALKEYSKKFDLEPIEKSRIEIITEELNKPSKDADIHAEVLDFMLKELMKKYSFIDNEGNIVKYKGGI